MTTNPEESSMELTDIMPAVAAEELFSALTAAGIPFDMCELRPCGHVSIVFPHHHAAVSMLTRAVPEGGPGSLRDRACSGFATLAELADADVDPDDPRAVDAFTSGWAWAVYPSMKALRVTWHVSVDLPPEDAATVAANINRFVLTGELA